MATDPHPLAGKKVRLKPNRGHKALDGAIFRVEGRWIDIEGESWTDCRGNPAVAGFIARRAVLGLPGDDEGVLYGKVGGLGYLIHAEEIEDVIDAE